MDMQRILRVNHLSVLSTAVKTISRMDQFELGSAASQQYSLNRVWHNPNQQTQSQRVKLWSMKITSIDLELFVMSWNQGESGPFGGSPYLLRRILTGGYDPRVVELFVTDTVCSQSDQEMACT